MKTNKSILRHALRANKKDGNPKLWFYYMRYHGCGVTAKVPRGDKSLVMRINNKNLATRTHRQESSDKNVLAYPTYVVYEMAS